MAILLIAALAAAALLKVVEAISASRELPVMLQQTKPSTLQRRVSCLLRDLHISRRV